MIWLSRYDKMQNIQCMFELSNKILNTHFSIEHIQSWTIYKLSDWDSFNIEWNLDKLMWFMIGYLHSNWIYNGETIKTS